MTDGDAVAVGQEESVWARIADNDASAPKYCPHCGEELAHPDNMKENDDLQGWPSRIDAYRNHRQAHFNWGADPANLYEGGDPFLADYYDGIEQDSGPTLDEDEEVASVYDVEINYEAVLRARVVASNESQAKERAQMLRKEGKDLTGDIPEAHITHELHDTAREVKTLTRGEIKETEDVDESEDEGVNYADRLPGWPW